MLLMERPTSLMLLMERPTSIASYTTQVGKPSSSTEEIAYVKSNIEWASSSSPAAPELRGI